VIECSGGSCDVAGNRNFVNFARPIPRLRATVPLGWNYDMHGATVMLHYISSYQDDFNSAAAGKPPDYATIGAWLAVDLQYAITIPEGDAASTKIAIGVQNLLDADPPKVNVGLGYDVFTHDPRGRILYARLTQQM
jgi:iron complex outermembrane receptor protein